MCQSTARRWSSVRKAVDLRRKLRLAAARLIETVLRSFVVRMRFVQTKTRVIRIQSVVRALAASRGFAERRRKIAVVQSIYRGRVAKIYLRESREAVTKISASWKGHKAVQEFIRTKDAATKLSSFARRIRCTASYKQAITSKFNSTSDISSKINSCLLTFNHIRYHTVPKSRSAQSRIGDGISA